MAGIAPSYLSRIESGIRRNAGQIKAIFELLDREAQRRLGQSIGPIPDLPGNLNRVFPFGGRSVAPPHHSGRAWRFLEVPRIGRQREQHASVRMLDLTRAVGLALDNLEQVSLPHELVPGPDAVLCRVAPGEFAWVHPTDGVVDGQEHVLVMQEAFVVASVLVLPEGVEIRRNGTSQQLRSDEFLILGVVAPKGWN